jgi:pimeloyl-ACP methyl ester carboxylesterase
VAFGDIDDTPGAPGGLAAAPTEPQPGWRRRLGRLSIGLLATAAAIASGVVLMRPAEVPLATLRARYGSAASRFLRLADGALLHVRDEGRMDGPVLLLIPGLHSPTVRATLERAFGNDALVTDGMVDRYFETINGEGHRRTLGQRLAYLLSYEPIEHLEGVIVPTLILWRDQYSLRPVLYARMFHDRIRGSVLRVYPGVGRSPMEEAADETAADVRAFMRDGRAAAKIGSGPR